MHLIIDLIHALIRFLLQLGYFGPFVLGVLDSSFLFVPIGNDLLIVVLTARHHQAYLWYVLTGAAGSAMGVFLVDLVARRLGETGIRRVAGDKKFEYLSCKIGQKGAAAIAMASLAPPPFPFTMVVGVTCALGYSRAKLIAIVAGARAVRFLILGYLAIRYGRWILRVIGSPGFKWTMVAVGVVCVVGSVYSLMKWFRHREK